jgi:magnesium transporter
MIDYLFLMNSTSIPPGSSESDVAAPGKGALAERGAGSRRRLAMVMNCVAYKDGKRIGQITVEEISDVLKEEGTFVWLGLREPSPEMLTKIQEEFALHELAIEDTRSAHQRPKLEQYGNSLFLVLQTAQLTDGVVQFGETHVFVGSRFLISIRHSSSLSYQKVRERCESRSEWLAKGPGFALYALMDFVVDNYVPVIDGLHERFERLEAEIFKHRFSRETLEQLYELKRELLLLRGATVPLLDICSELMRFHASIVPKDIRFYFRDISDHVTRINQSIDGMREMLAVAMQVHLALVTVAQNEVVKRLAGWGALLAIPTMVFSLYGMNFKHMPELEGRFSYPAVLGVLLIACILLYVKLKRAGWL